MSAGFLSVSIYNTISYFDIFEYPLTLIEVYKWLWQPPKEGTNLFELAAELEILKNQNKIAQKNGLYFLAGNERHVETRLRRYRITEPKFKIAMVGGFILRYVPFIRMMAVCNNVGYNNCRKESDIDFFIIAKSGRLWTVRLAVTVILTLFRLRRHGFHDADRVCLSFYLADSNQDLSQIALKPDDPYLVYWLATLAPIYQFNNDYEKFLSDNIWFKNYLPNYYGNLLSNRRVVKDNTYSLVSKNGLEKFLAGKFGDWLESVFTKLQIVKVKKYFGVALNLSDGNVVIDKNMLKFHKTDRRLEYRSLWQQKKINL